MREKHLTPQDVQIPAVKNYLKVKEVVI